MVIVIEVVLNPTVAFIDFPAGHYRTFIGRFCGPQVVTICLHIKIHTHSVTSATNNIGQQGALEGEYWITQLNSIELLRHFSGVNTSC